MRSHPRFNGRAALVSALMFGLLTGCGGNATITGKVSDQPGTQHQGLSSGPDGFGGSGSAAAATKVRASSIGSNGALTTVAEANVSASGTYSLNIPPDQRKLIVQAIDANGNVVSSTIIETSGEPSHSVTAPPMDTETSVEAEVLVEMVTQGTSLAEANAIDLRARINADVAQAVKATAAAGGDAHAKIRGLAEAVIAAQRAQIKALAQAGVQTSQSALFEAQLNAATTLNQKLDNGSATADAYATFFTQLQSAATQVGADAKKQAQAERAAGVSFRATAQVRIQSSSSAPDPVADAAIRQEAVLEGHASTAAVDAVLQAGAAASAVQASAVQAETTLKAQLAAATTASASASAFAAYKASISGSASASSSVLGAYLGANAATEVTLQAALTASATAAATLDTALSTAISASVKATGSVDFDGLANAVVNAYAAYDTAVHAQATALAAFGTNVQPALDLVVVTQGSFQLGG